MNVKFDKISAVAAELTVSIEKADYEARVEKALKDYRKKAALPGFRPGQAPLSILKKRFGNEITAEEVQKMLSEKLFGYIREEKIDMLGEPLASEKQQPIDFEADQLDFIFDIALAPAFDAKLTAKDKIPYYTIKVEEGTVEGRIDGYRQRGGQYNKVEDWQTGDMTKGVLTEVTKTGRAKKDGVVKEDAVILPNYFKDEDQKALFTGVKVNDIITINPSKAYAKSEVEISSLLGIEKEAAAKMTSDFTYQITEITRYTPAELNQELFDNVLGKDAVKNEKEFRAAIKAQVEQQYAEDAAFRFMIDVRQYLEKRIGKVEWPDELLHRIMKMNNPDKDEKYFEDNYAPSLKELEWHLIKEQLSDQLGIKVEHEDVLETAKMQTRMQFAQYGLGNAPEDLVAKYAQEMLNKKEQAERIVAQCVEQKIGAALKDVVKLTPKEITMDEFNKLFQK